MSGLTGTACAVTGECGKHLNMLTWNDVIRSRKGPEKFLEHRLEDIV